MTVGGGTQLISVHPDELKFLYIFNKDGGGKLVEECKLRVVYLSPSAQGNAEDETFKSTVESPETNSTLQRLKDERDAATRLTQQLQRDLDMMKR